MENLVDNVISTLADKGVRRSLLTFGGPGEVPKKITIPTDARSEFLANRAMGDWAENALAKALGVAKEIIRVVSYGDSDRMAAGEPGFRDFYMARLDEVRLHGKRPDLLLFTPGSCDEGNLSTKTFEEVDDIVKTAIGGIEVRSSKFEADKYIAVRLSERKSGKATARETPSFTVKVEDLRIVYRWIQQYQLPQVYCQVFFDSAYVINFAKIFDIIASGCGFTIETPAKSQLKSTIMIPITSGNRIGTMDSMPSFKAEERITRLGRHDAYVVPKGGELRVDSAEFLRVLQMYD